MPGESVAVVGEAADAAAVEVDAAIAAADTAEGRAAIVEADAVTADAVTVDAVTVGAVTVGAEATEALIVVLRMAGDPVVDPCTGEARTVVAPAALSPRVDLPQECRLVDRIAMEFALAPAVAEAVRCMADTGLQRIPVDVALDGRVWEALTDREAGPHPILTIAAASMVGIAQAGTVREAMILTATIVITAIGIWDIP